VPTEVMRGRASDNPYFHPDFHGALSAGIGYLDSRYGADAVRRYLRQFALSHYAPLRKQLTERGLVALKEHFERVYDREGGKVEITLRADELLVKIEECPAVRHMRRRGHHVARLFGETTTSINKALCEGTPFSSQTLDYDDQTGAAVVRFRRRSAQ
jgi:hypothetical protein